EGFRIEWRRGISIHGHEIQSADVGSEKLDCRRAGFFPSLQRWLNDNCFVGIECWRQRRDVSLLAELSNRACSPRVSHSALLTKERPQHGIGERHPTKPWILLARAEVRQVHK